MRPVTCLQACRPSVPLGIVTLCLMARWTFQAQGEVSLHVPQPNVNTTVEQNILLSVAYTCEGTPIIKWKHTSPRGTTEIAEWKPGSYTNISISYEGRVNVYENGSLQLLKVDLRDSGYYLVTVRDKSGFTIYGTILLNVYAVSAILICFMWLCNKSIHLLQERQQLKASTTEETELQMMDVS
ncbi:V-set and transmembrane domain-containing protein 5 isoform X2 [Sceloporus undulatus]|uniref:V-set and transmembrane domain-containing protein 5 isoform X2 n=1 Tax=Sceloporus undulatus TaxID=8520 RepID=UPI001C4B9B29|nr:V-set and transmembrane domain-containing protein 5 isoform X2 [Sceloporus undulatus]